MLRGYTDKYTIQRSQDSPQGKICSKLSWLIILPFPSVIKGTKCVQHVGLLQWLICSRSVLELRLQEVHLSSWSLWWYIGRACFKIIQARIWNVLLMLSTHVRTQTETRSPLISVSFIFLTGIETKWNFYDIYYEIMDAFYYYCWFLSFQLFDKQLIYHDGQLITNLLIMRDKD